MFEAGVVRITAPGQEQNKDIFSIFFNMKVYCVFLLKSPHRSDSNEYTKYTILNINDRKIILHYSQSAAMGFFEGSQERV